MNTMFLVGDGDPFRLWSDNTNKPWVFLPDQDNVSPNPRWLKVFRHEKIPEGTRWQYIVPSATFQVIESCHVWVEMALIKLKAAMQEEGGHFLIYYHLGEARRIGMAWAAEPFPLLDRARLVASSIDWCTIPN